MNLLRKSKLILLGLFLLASFSFAVPVEITTWAELAAINDALSGDYILVNDLSSATTGYDTYASSSANGGAGWTPLGEPIIGTFPGSPFTGTFDGDGFSINDLYIKQLDGRSFGLFSWGMVRLAI